MSSSRTGRSGPSPALALACACALGVACSPAAGPREPVPVVLLIADTLRADVLGCYGGEAGASPELDALAREGVLFERVIAPSSWTRPSTGALLTGLLPRRLGLYRERNQRLPERVTTLAEALGAAGWRTWAAVANPSLNGIFGFDQGYDRYRESRAVFTSFMEPDAGQQSYAEEGLVPARELLAETLAALPDDPARPWLVTVNLMETHEYARGELALTSSAYRLLYRDRESPRREYLQAVRQLSADIAGFVEALRSRPGWERTLFVVTSDHGEGLDSHPRVPGGQLHGTLLYESQVRVPLLLLQPELPRGLRVETPVRLLDVMPTLLELVGVEPPEGLDGVSLVPLLRGDDREAGLPRYFVTETRFRPPLDRQAVYGPEWSYFEHRDDLPGTAPRELHPAGAVPRRPSESVLASRREQAQRMRRYLEAWRRAHPRAEPTPTERRLTEEERAALKAIGYLKKKKTGDRSGQPEPPGSPEP